MRNCGCCRSEGVRPRQDGEEGVRRRSSTHVITPDKDLQMLVTSVAHSGSLVSYEARMLVDRRRIFVGVSLQETEIRVAVDDDAAVFADDAWEMIRQRKAWRRVRESVGEVSESLVEVGKKYKHPFTLTPSRLLGMLVSRDLRNEIDGIGDGVVTAYLAGSPWDIPSLSFDGCYEDGGYCSPEFRSCSRCNSMLDFGERPGPGPNSCDRNYMEMLERCVSNYKRCARNCSLLAVDLGSSGEVVTDIMVPDVIGESPDLGLSVCLQVCQSSLASCLASADAAYQFCAGGFF